MNGKEKRERQRILILEALQEQRLCATGSGRMVCQPPVEDAHPQVSLSPLQRFIPCLREREE